MTATRSQEISATVVAAVAVAAVADAWVACIIATTTTTMVTTGVPLMATPTTRTTPNTPGTGQICMAPEVIRVTIRAAVETSNTMHTHRHMHILTSNITHIRTPCMLLAHHHRSTCMRRTGVAMVMGHPQCGRHWGTTIAAPHNNTSTTAHSSRVAIGVVVAVATGGNEAQTGHLRKSAWMILM